MWKGALLVVVPFLLVFSDAIGDSLISKGKWKVEKLSRCPDDDQYRYKIEFKKRKLNRTHDVYDADLDFPMEITNDNTGMYIEACKKVDGGCKLVHVFDEPCFCSFLMKYAPSNFKTLLGMAGLEKDCPIPQGQHKVENFMFDNNELPEEGMKGSFEATAFLTKDKERLGCVLVDVYLDTSEDDDDDE